MTGKLNVGLTDTKILQKKVLTKVGDPGAGVSLVLRGVLLRQLPEEGVCVQERNVPHLHPCYGHSVHAPRSCDAVQAVSLLLMGARKT